MIEIQIDPVFASLIPEELIRQTAQTAFKQQELSQNVEMSLVITGDEEIKAYNLQYFDIDAPTDVISFPASENKYTKGQPFDGEINPETGNLYLGDIIISYSRAVNQAESNHNNPEDELCLLVVHGILHLLGYDHAGEDEKAIMWHEQAEILKQAGRPPINP
jgi:probable rRNA maturation factor